MRLGWTTSNYTTTYRAIKTIRVNGKNRTKIIKTFGSEKYICETYGVTDPKAWAKEQVRLMNEAEKEDAATFTIELNSGTDLVMDEQRRFNGGYLFLQAIYYELGLHKICRAIANRHSFEYDLNDIVSRLIYTRILYPSSKRSSFQDIRAGGAQRRFPVPDQRPDGDKEALCDEQSALSLHQPRRKPVEHPPQGRAAPIQRAVYAPDGICVPTRRG